MNEEIAKGTLDKVSGTVKEAVGHLIGSEELEAKGKLDQAKGSAETTLGHAEDAAKEIGHRIDKAID